MPIIPANQTQDILAYQTFPGYQQLSLMHTPAAVATALDSTQLSIAYAGGNTAEVRNHAMLLILRVMSALDTGVAPRALRKL